MTKQDCLSLSGIPDRIFNEIGADEYVKTPPDYKKSEASAGPQIESGVDSPQPKSGSGTSPQTEKTAAASRLTQMQGILVALASYAFWGILPLFWKLLEHVEPLEILAHRLFWSATFLVLICLAACRSAFLALFRKRRAVLILLGAGLICTLNWGLFIYAVNTDHVLQVSMGYYINPLMTIAIGMLLFKEKLTPAQKIAFALVTAGVLFFTINYGSFPWLSIALAVTFGFYGVLKKIGGYPALPALALETTLVAPLALTYIVVAFFAPEHAFFALDVSGAFNSAGLITSLLLICGGIVTFVPLLLFSEAINIVPLSLLGFMQYLSPTITLLLGVFAFQEEFTLAHAVCFALIWIGLLLIVFEALLKQRRARK